MLRDRTLLYQSILVQPKNKKKSMSKYFLQKYLPMNNAIDNNAILLAIPVSLFFILLR